MSDTDDDGHTGRAKEIYENYKQLLSTDFINLKTNKERIEYVFSKVKTLQEFREEVYKKADIHCYECRKDVQKCQILRAKGLQAYRGRQTDYDLAVDCFRKAILSAPFPTEENQCDDLSLCYASRCRLWYMMGKYENALFDANHSIELSPTFDMLLKRVWCLRFMKKFEESILAIEDMIEKANNNELILENYSIEGLQDLRDTIAAEQHYFSGDIKNEQIIPKESVNYFIHPSVEIVSTPEKGRYMIAKEPIPQNTLIMFERPYSITLNAENILYFCSNCYQNIGDKIWPCEGCDEVVFCNQQCANEATNQYHKYWCGITGIILQFGLVVQQVFSIFSKIGCFNAYKCEQSVAVKGFDFSEYMASDRHRTIPEKEKTKHEKMSHFKTFATLVHHNSDFNENSDLTLIHTFMAIEGVILLKYKNAIEIDIFDDIYSFLRMAVIFIVNIRRISCNAFGWYDSETSPPIELGSSQCLVTALVNHSCVPNTQWHFENIYIRFTAHRDIKKGEEINISYGSIYKEPFDKRQVKLRIGYYFACMCRACVSDLKNVKALRCLSCDGYVSYKSETTESYCMKCYKDYESIRRAIAEVECNRVLFEDLIEDITNDPNFELHLAMAESCLDAMIRLIYPKNNTLLSRILQLLQIFVNSNKFSNAVKYLKLLIDYIDSDEVVSVDILKILILSTFQYYNHIMFESEVKDREEFKKCLDLYTQLVQLLEIISEEAGSQVQDMIITAKEEKENLEMAFETF